MPTSPLLSRFGSSSVIDGMSAGILFPTASCLWMSVCRAEDYWEGYKLFCYGYYSHSIQHEHEFRHCKLGSFMGARLAFVGVFWFQSSTVVCQYVNCKWVECTGCLTFFLAQGTLCGSDIATHLLLPGM